MGKIGIIGAGMAGLSCGDLLRQHGEEVEIFDRREIPGGRCSSIRQEGFVIDLGAQTFFGGYLRTREMAARLGLASSCLKTGLPPGYLRRGRIYDFSPFFFPAHVHPLQFFSFDVVSWKTRYMAAKFVSRLFLGRDPIGRALWKNHGSLGNSTIYDFVRKEYSLELYTDLIEPCLSAWALRDPANLAAPFALSYLRHFYSGFWTVMGGMGYLAEKLVKRIRKVRLQQDVSKVEADDGRSVILRVGKEERRYDRVVVATDAHQAAQLLADFSVSQILNEVAYSPALIAVTALNHRPERIADQFEIFSPRKEGHPFAAVINSAAKFIGNVPPRGTALHWFIDRDQAPNAYTETDRYLEQLVDHEARAMFLDYSKPRFVRIVRWPRARVTPDPANLAILGRIPEQAAPRIYLAGSYFHASGAEGAILSGRDTAYRILEDQKRNS